MATKKEGILFPWHHGTGAQPSYVEELDGLKNWVEKTRDSGSKAFREFTPFDWAALFLPCLRWLRTYRVKEWLLWDLLAGISVGFMIIPQSMSYANIAGVPSVYGLYGAFLPLAVYALLGSSKQLGVGPVAVTSLLIGNGIRAMVPGSENIDNPNNPGEFAGVQDIYNHKVIQVAFLVACMYTGVGALRLGFIVRFLSHSVITGFTRGAAVIISMSQVRYILGYKVPRMDSLHEIIKVLIAGRAGFKWKECVMGLAMLGFLIGLKVISKRVKKLHWLAALGPIMACAISIIAVVAGKLDRRGIKVVEKIPQGLPSPTIGWWAPVNNLGPMLGLSAVVMLVDLLESTSIARALARKNGYELSYNQEIVGLGIANFAGAMFNSYTTTGSFSRSAVNNSSGAKTQLAGFITSMVVMFVLLFLTKVFELLPYNTMAAIIIAGVMGLVEFDTAIYLMKTHLRDFAVWLVAFLATLFLGIELGLAAAIGLALLIVIFESAFPHTAVLGRVDRTTVYRNVEQYPGAEMVPGVLVVRLDAPVYFANVQWMEDKLVAYEAEALRFARANGIDRVEYIILDLTPVPHMDSMGAHFLEELHQSYKARGIQLILTNPSPRVVRLMERSGLIAKIGRDWIFVRVHDAVVNCQRSLMQMEAGGSLATPTWQPMGMVSPVFQSEGGAGPNGAAAGSHGGGPVAPGAAAGASLGL
ncbi:hypothetical protein OEZ86_008861 [Tetradesmus obliquus]|nr:hypothetical protein OEZ86_008861 [Tetradesmus obliquus]